MGPRISRSLPSLDRSSRLSLRALKLVTRVFFFKCVTLDYAKCNSQFWSFLYMYKLGEVSSNFRRRDFPVPDQLTPQLQLF